MVKLGYHNQEADGRKVREDINQLDRIGFGTGAVSCQLCGTDLQEGGSVTVYAFRPVSDPDLEIGSVFCEEHDNEVTSMWTRGVRELVVRGRVGMVSVAAEQSSGPVLLDPELVVVSPADAMEAYTYEELLEVRGPSTEAISGAVSGDESVEVNDAVREVNEVVEPDDSIRPVSESLPSRDDSDRGDVE